MTLRILFRLMVPVALVLASAGCGKQDALSPLARSTAGAVDVQANAARLITLPFHSSNFSQPVANPYFPLTPGLILVYTQETSEGTEVDTVEVTSQTKMILGVATRVVHDRVYRSGALKEDTFDWYQADNSGNVWYFGEDTREVGPPPSTAGSWEAGVNGAQAGIIMLARPAVGDTYYQENAPGVVEDRARVKALDQTVMVPYDTFTGCIKTQEWTALESGNRAFKYYAAGLGMVMEEPNKNDGPVVLVSRTGP